MGLATPPPAAAKETVGACPLCASDVVEGRRAYGCQSRDCDFEIRTMIAKRKISQTLARVLLAKGVSRRLKGFRSRKGKSFAAALRVAEDGRIQFDFDRKDGDSPRKGRGASTSRRPRAASKPPGPRPPRCPACRKGEIIKGRRGWGCSNYRQGCTFVVWFRIGDFQIPEDEAERLFRRKQTRLMQGLVPGAKARLVLDLEATNNVRVERGKR